MKKQIALMLMIIILGSCGGKKNNPAPKPSPSRALLTFPDQDAVCTNGTIISDTESALTFMWTAATNTDSYDLYLKNLLTGNITIQTTTATQFTITLLRNTPYSWYVVSRSVKTSSTAETDTWKFYNAGKGVTTYAPFPAAISSPTLGQILDTPLGKVNLTWKGSAVTIGSISNYDVYFGTTKSPGLLKDKIADSFLNDVVVVSGSTYYWKVVTRDFAGNTSDSELFQFLVK
ncbi:MAG: hypothetical protein ABIN13_14065 [Mucilaginibacter sp.]